MLKNCSLIIILSILVSANLYPKTFEESYDGIYKAKGFPFTIEVEYISRIDGYKVKYHYSAEIIPFNEIVLIQEKDYVYRIENDFGLFYLILDDETGKELILIQNGEMMIFTQK